ESRPSTAQLMQLQHWKHLPPTQQLTPSLIPLSCLIKATSTLPTSQVTRQLLSTSATASSNSARATSADPAVTPASCSKPLAESTARAKQALPRAHTFCT